MFGALLLHMGTDDAKLRPVLSPLRRRICCICGSRPHAEGLLYDTSCLASTTVHAWQVLLDIGAGQGLFSLAAAARGHRAIALEASPLSADPLQVCPGYLWCLVLL